MKKALRRNRMRLGVVGMLLALTGAGVIAIVHAGGLATQPVGKISGELVITSEDGVKQGVVTATQTYLQSTKEGTAQVTIKKDSVRLASASARLKADTQEQAAAAVSALILYLTGKPARPGMQCQDINDGGYRGLQCSDIKFEGDSRVFAEQADKIIDWWDAQASLTHTGYVSPRPNLANLGRLHLNVWGRLRDDIPWRASSAMILFDPVDPTLVQGGVIYTGVGQGGNEILFGSLKERTQTAAPGDFDLSLLTQLGTDFKATLLLETQQDGTVDVRGVTNDWGTAGGPLVVEGVGSDKFVVPGASSQP